jgi:hypothetical protein
MSGSAFGSVAEQDIVCIPKHKRQGLPVPTGPDEWHSPFAETDAV